MDSIPFCMRCPQAECWQKRQPVCLYCVTGNMLLAQTIFDFAFGLAFGIGLYRKAYNKLIYMATMIVAAVLVFLLVYQPFLLLF